MARIRSIKPELLEDEKVARLTHLEYRVFVSSFLLADDYGNFRAAPERIHGSVLWAHPREGLAKALERLAAVGLLVFYTVADQLYVHISGWEKHQKVDHPGKPLCPALTADSRLSREGLAKILDPLAPDLDQDPDQEEDHDQDPSASSVSKPPDQTRTESEPRANPPAAPVWAAYRWLEKFKAAYWDKFGNQYGQAGDSKACGTLADLLTAFAAPDLLAAQARSGAMFAEFFGIEKPETVRRGHPFAFFVQEWGALRLDRAKPQQTVAESFAQRDARIRTEQRERERVDSARSLAATDAKVAELRRIQEAMG